MKRCDLFGWRSGVVVGAGVLVLVLAIGAPAHAAVNICPGDPGCGGPCTTDADCTSDSNSCAPSPGGSCVQDAAGLGEDRCICNPGFNPPFCQSGACCSPDGSCSHTGEAACADGGLYQGDNVSCTAVNCPLGCGYASAPQCGGFCSGDLVCVPISAATNGLAPTGECECVPPTPTPTPTSTPTSTPSATATSTKVPMGGTCEETSDCAAGLVCQEQVCTSTAAEAPVTSNRGVLMIVAILVAIGGLTIFRLRSQD